MDAGELLRKCQVNVSKEEETNIVTFMGRMKIKGEEITANCLVGKVLTSKSINNEGLKAAMQMAWRTVKEVKIESMRDNIFLFKFAAREEKKRVLMGGPWHFDRALLVLTEPLRIGDIKNQSFSYATFWVQTHNIPIMCMNKEAIQQLGEKIGTVQEVETDEAGDCIGQFARVRISINISQPLKKIVFLQQEDDKIPMPILYEKLPDFCFCCAHIGHQYKECLRYKGQQKEALPYGSWMRAGTHADRLKQGRSREKGGREHSNSQANVQAATRPTTSNPGVRDGSELNQVGGATTGIETEAASTKPNPDLPHLMLTSPETQQHQVGSQSMGCDITEVQPREVNNNRSYSYASTQEGENILKVGESPVDKASLRVLTDKMRQPAARAGSAVDARGHGPSKPHVWPKVRKWKLKASVPIVKEMPILELPGKKRSSTLTISSGHHTKKQRVLRPLEQSPVGPHISLVLNSNHCHHIHPISSVRQFARSAELSAGRENAAAMEEDVSAGAEIQARRQP